MQAQTRYTVKLSEQDKESHRIRLGSNHAQLLTGFYFDLVNGMTLHKVFCFMSMLLPPSFHMHAE